jgi:hypothetical protein
MIEQGAFDAWGLRTPPAWAQRALEKGIIDESRFHALIRVASETPSLARRTPRHPRSCSCRRRPTRSCTRWRA